MTEQTTDISTKRKEAVERMKTHCVEVLMSQTTWSEEEARAKLEENEYNVQACVRIFMGMPPKKDIETSTSITSKTVNQHIYGNIRSMMDEASKRYEKRKIMEQRIQEAKETYAKIVLSQQNNANDDVSDISGSDHK